MSDNTETDKKSVAARLVGMAQERYLLGLSDEVSRSELTAIARTWSCSSAPARPVYAPT